MHTYWFQSGSEIEFWLFIWIRTRIKIQQDFAEGPKSHPKAASNMAHAHIVHSGAASVVVGDKLYMFGGYGGNGRLDDFFEYHQSCLFKVYFDVRTSLLQEVNFDIHGLHYVQVKNNVTINPPYGNKSEGF